MKNIIKNIRFAFKQKFLDTNYQRICEPCEVMNNLEADRQYNES